VREVAATVLYTVRGDLALGRAEECVRDGVGPAGDAVMAQLALALDCEGAPEGSDARGILEELLQEERRQAQGDESSQGDENSWGDETHGEVESQGDEAQGWGENQGKELHGEE